MPTNWTWVYAECVEKCGVVLSTDKNMDGEKQTETQWEKKTEVLLCGPSSRRETVPVDCLSVGESSIPFSNAVKTFGVILCLNRCQIIFFSTSDLWVKSVHTSPTKLQAALLSVWFCQSLTTAIAFCRDCPTKQIKRLQAVQNAAARTVMKCKKKKKITSLPFLGSFIGFLSRNGSATKFSLPLTGQFMITPPSTSLIFSKNATLLAF